MKKVIITGGAGFIGSHVAEEFIKKGCQVRVLDIYLPCDAVNLTTIINHPNLEYIQCDIVRKEELANWISSEYQTIYHFASVVGISKYIETPLKVVDVNVIGTRNIFELALEYDIKIVFSSTSEIYGKNPDIPWSEDHDRVLGPTFHERWTYSSSKAVAEHLANAMHRAMGLRVLTVRFFNVYGPRQNPIFVVSQNVKNAIAGLPMKMYDGGRQTRCFTYVNDAVDALIRLSEKEGLEGETFNIGSNRETEVGELLKIINASVETQVEIEKIDTNQLYGESYQDIQRRVPDVSKINKELSWKASTSLEDGIRETIKWFKLQIVKSR